jgi:hypothetical protein
MWNSRSENTLIERNLIVDNSKPMRLGIGGRGGDGYWVWNNLIINTDTDTLYPNRYPFEVGDNATTGGIYHNTVWNPAHDSAEQLAKCFNDFPIENNTYHSGEFDSCTGLNNNIQIQDSTAYVSVGNINFHLTQNRTVPKVDTASVDIDGNTRANPPSAGAYEFNPASNMKGLGSRIKGPKLELDVHPNPFKGKTRIVIRNVLPVFNPRAEVYDINGRMVKSVNIRNPRLWTVSFIWDAADNADGIYFVKVTAGNAIHSQKICLVK